MKIILSSFLFELLHQLFVRYFEFFSIQFFYSFYEFDIHSDLLLDQIIVAGCGGKFIGEKLVYSAG